MSSNERHHIRSIFGTAGVYTYRHLPPCRLSNLNARGCNCPKWLYVHEKGQERKRMAAGTGSFTEACERAQEVLNSFDPRLQELATRRAAEIRRSKPIEQFLLEYYDDLAAQARSKSYIANVQALFGKRNRAGVVFGNLLKFLERINSERPLTDKIVTIGQLDTAFLQHWRTSWIYNDMTAAQRLGMVRSFFRWAMSRGEISSNLAMNLRPGSIRKGNRCGYFTEAQFASIIQAVPLYRPANVDQATRNVLPRRLIAIIEFMRGSGMALIDTVLWRPEKIQGGVLRYRRQKSGSLAVVPLEPRLVAMLEAIPPETDSSPEQPFGFQDIDVQSACSVWRRRFQAVCKLAGIRVLHTEAGGKLKPHPHALRDSFAIWHLTHGTRLDTVSKMLGHNRTAITEKHYLAWCPEREEAVIADARETLEGRRGQAFSRTSDSLTTLVQ